MDLYRSYLAYIHLNLAGWQADPKEPGDWLKPYHAGWEDYRELAKEHPNCASLYGAHGARFGGGDGLDKVVAEFRRKIGTKQQVAAVQ